MYNLLYDYQILLMQKYGGISRYFYEVIERVPKEEFKLLFPVIGNQNYYFQDYFGKEIRDIHGMKNYNRIVKMNQAYTRHLLKKGRDNIVFHPTYYNPYFLEGFKGKLVVTVHDMIHENYPEYYGGNATIDHKKSLMDRADKIIAVSKTTKRDILNIYPDIDENKIAVIYHGNVKESPVIVNEVYAEKYFKNGKFVLYVGNRDRYKNFHNFAVAVASILKKDDKLQLVCVGGGELLPEEKEIFENEDCLNRVIQVGASEGELVWLYQNASCFVFPSKAEGFGIPILEAWKNKCPVILSDMDCFREVGSEAAMYFNPDSPNDIQDKVADVLYGTIGAELVQRGTEREKEFSWDKCAREHFEVYKEVCENGK